MITCSGEASTKLKASVSVVMLRNRLRHRLSGSYF